MVQSRYLNFDSLDSVTTDETNLCVSLALEGGLAELQSNNPLNLGL
jgi:hypothetical protein